MAPPPDAPLNPSNVPTGGNLTYAALEPITEPQLRLLGHLRRLCGNPPTWVDDCRLILGKGWDGEFRSLSVAAGSWLISELQRGIKAVADPDDDLQIQGAPV